MHEVIALHAILMSGAIGEMREGRFTEGVVFEPPKIAEVEADAIADRPVVILPFDGIRQRASLCMALDASVIGFHVVHPRGIENVAARGMFNMVAAGSVGPAEEHAAMAEMLKITPLGREGRPEEIAGIVAFLLGPDARFLCGSILFVDGGTDALLRPNDWPVPLQAL